jgi:uncharacterized protein
MTLLEQTMADTSTTTTAITTKQASALSWFEIPAVDIERAQAFYEKFLGAPMRRETIGSNTLAVFAYGETGVGGCVMVGPQVPAPRTDGSLIFLNAAPSLDAVLARVEAAGGRITTPKVTLPGDMGMFVHITDTEGNRVGLHALA